MNGKTIALFDFDGTITTGDSFLAFLRYHFGSFRFFSALMMLAPAVIRFAFGAMRDEELKRRFCRYFFAGVLIDELTDSAEMFVSDIIPGMLRPRAVAALEKHVADGDDVVIVSASFSLWLSFFAKRYETELISTELARDNGAFTGDLSTPNCKGPEKVRRISERYDLDSYDVVYAYGDTSGDAEMLAAADEGRRFFREFHD